MEYDYICVNSNCENHTDQEKNRKNWNVMHFDVKPKERKDQLCPFCGIVLKLIPPVNIFDGITKPKTTGIKKF